jgi:hypothetical protein
MASSSERASGTSRARYSERLVLVRYQPFPAESRLRLLKGHVGRREDHFRFDELLFRYSAPSGPDELQHLTERLAERRLIIPVTKRDSPGVQLVHRADVVIAELVLTLSRDAHDHE